MATNREILVVDDSVTNVFLLESVLKEYGYGVITALNATDALKKIKEKHPDLILLDLLMPHIDGFTFIKELKDSPEFKKIPVVIVSAVTDQDSIQRIMSMGAIEYIRKPVVLTSLIEKIEEILK
ncbi:MAG: response regulator [Bacteroidales bacterium]|nr:response regulator [Bacteroidales bacterium]